VLSPIFRLGLTGGIGSGKSTVARLLEKQGATVIDADAIAHELTVPNGRAMPAIAAVFGQVYLTTAGALDRAKMRTLAYSEPDSRKRLEAIIHPLVAQEIKNKSDLALESGGRCLVFDIPLLVESATWRQKVDHVLVIDCTPEVQVNRVMARNQLARSEIEKIIAAQAGRIRRLAAADSVIFNSNLTLDELALEVRQILPRFGLS
jgi:dephospho-CoA kinase